MPSGRRILSRVQTASSSAHKCYSSNSYSEERENVIPLVSMVTLPRHGYLPDIPRENNLLFEFLLYMLGVLILFLQYVNLYKTVWWLPHSHANYALNFYLIDPYLVSFLLLLMSRRLVWCFVQEVYGSKNKKSVLYWFVQLIKLVIVTGILGTFCWSAYHVIVRYSFVNSLFLCYPLATYLILFGFTLKPIFQKNLLWPCQVVDKSVSPSSSQKHKNSQDSSHISSEDSVLSHTCTLTPDIVREEVECLKLDFNNRVKQVLFNSMLTAYYMAFVPLCFAQNTLYYDTYWVGQHVCLAWLCAFLLLIVHFLPPQYLDLLHKCALHLGRWQKVEGRHAHVPYNPWSELQVWPPGVLVKHVRGLFRAEGINITAEPGNSMHSRFYFLFHWPLRITNYLLFLSFTLVIYQFVRLLLCTEWNHIVSLALMLFCCDYTLFKLFRDRVILTSTYKDEEEKGDNSH
ncbi:transmembrane protein 39A-A isoform X2 [Octopus bimaculoides]|uniref:transmembrane protein 39A-A isoform X2 n=1 Tax=Octopus bimaculoides TaxID=37653 RepID=UPI0022E25706|nr:transmembrane protein 39A-A isoform X2 [Octopus bimaculoides]